MAWNRGKQGFSPKKKTKKTPKTKKRIAKKKVMLAERAAKRRKRA